MCTYIYLNFSDVCNMAPGGDTTFSDSPETDYQIVIMLIWTYLMLHGSNPIHISASHV